MSQFDVEGGSCDRYWEIMSAMADGEATQAEEAELRVHVAECRDCAESLAFIQVTSQASRRLTRHTPPTALRQAIFAATTQRPSLLESLRAVVARRGLGIGLAAAGVAAAAYVLYLNHGSTPTPPGVPVAHIENPTVYDVNPMPAPVRVNEHNPAISPAVMAAPRRVAFAEGHGVAPQSGPGPAIPSGTKVARALPNIRSGFIGARTMVGVPPFDPRESATGYKPVARDASETSAPRIEPEPTAPEETNAAGNLAKTTPTETTKDKVAVATIDNGVARAGFDRARMQQEVGSAMKRSSDGKSFTLVRGKF